MVTKLSRGSFLLDVQNTSARVRGVTYETIDSEEALNIFNEINLNNMEIVLLKSSKIAIYSPPNKQPWDDAVTPALTYAEVPYDVLWDKEVFDEKLARYDWLHFYTMKILLVNMENFIRIIDLPLGT